MRSPRRKEPSASPLLASVSDRSSKALHSRAWSPPCRFVARLMQLIGRSPTCDREGQIGFIQIFAQWQVGFIVNRSYTRVFGHVAPENHRKGNARCTVRAIVLTDLQQCSLMLARGSQHTLVARYLTSVDIVVDLFLYLISAALTSSQLYRWYCCHGENPPCPERESRNQLPSGGKQRRRVPRLRQGARVSTHSALPWHSGSRSGLSCPRPCHRQYLSHTR